MFDWNLTAKTIMSVDEWKFLVNVIMKVIIIGLFHEFSQKYQLIKFVMK